MPPTLKCQCLPSSISICTKSVFRGSQTRSFSVTSQRNGNQRVTRARSQLWRWLGSQGANFRDPAENSTNYLSAYTPDGQLRRAVEARGIGEDEKKDDNKNQDGGAREAPKVPPETARDLRPFPANTSFISQAVLSEEMKEKIWEAVMVDGLSVRDASTEFSVEMSRIGAVVRLKEVEKEWERIGKPLATPYARAVMAMLPVTRYEPDKEKRMKRGAGTIHEPINDLPLHPATGQQIFHPTSESRVFTRADAAKVFDDNLLPADDRVPHPELTLMHKDLKAGYSAKEISERQAERDAEAEVRRLRREKKKGANKVKAVDTRRWEFRFTDINVDNAGKNGRGPYGVGWRYGLPHMDRKVSQVKIPTKVE